MTMDLHYATTQAKVKSKLYTSTAFEGTTEVKGYKLVTLVFDLPKTKSDIISIEYVNDNHDGVDILQHYDFFMIFIISFKFF